MPLAHPLARESEYKQQNHTDCNGKNTGQKRAEVGVLRHVAADKSP